MKLNFSKGSWGKLIWEENWVSFLDTMLQFSILSQPNRGLYLPTRLQRAVIDPEAVKNFAINNPAVSTEGKQCKKMHMTRMLMLLKK